MHWLNSRLGRKFALGTAGGLLASSLVFLVLFLALYRAELASERATAAGQVNQLLQTSLENAMLKRDLDGLRVIIDRLGQQPGIDSVFITNPAGEIRFASDASLLGKWHPTNPDQREAFTDFVSVTQGGEILRSVNPVLNQPQCAECHGPADLRPVNGTLYVNYDAAPIRQKARLTTLLLMGSGAVIVLLNLAGGWWFIRRHVIGPVDRLTATSRALAAGDLSRRTAPEGNDELAELGRAFDHMARQLKARIDESEHQRAFLQALIDAIPDGVRVISSDYRVLLTNQAYRQQQGLGDADGIGDSCHRISHQSDKPCPSTLITCPVHEIAIHPKPVKAIHRHYDAAGQVADVEIYAAPMNAIVDGSAQTLVVESIRDLSKEIKYSHEQKLSELGKLATGVAHEIHNPLASVRLALDDLRRGVSDADSEVAEYLELVDREIDRCVKFTERLLRLGMQPSETPELIEVGHVVEDTIGLLRWEAEEIGIAIATELKPGLRVLASDSEMRMIMLNLIQNAFHAMPAGGSLTVSGATRSPWVVIAVQDTGVGIEAERLPRIFDPFYSRRADGTKGTGLGLSIVRSIVERYGGHIDVQSDHGRGTVFTVFLPDPAYTAEVAP